MDNSYNATMHELFNQDSSQVSSEQISNSWVVSLWQHLRHDDTLLGKNDLMMPENIEMTSAGIYFIQNIFHSLLYQEKKQGEA